MANPVHWEKLKQDGHTLSNRALTRTKVPGGWIVRDGNGGGPDAVVNCFFLPDPEYAWTAEAMPDAP